MPRLTFEGVLQLSAAPLPQIMRLSNAYRHFVKRLRSLQPMIEWGTQHWKPQEPFPVPLVPRWLHTPEFMQMTTPLRGELPLIPTSIHFEDIPVRCPAVWAWMAVLLQYWQDHMTCHLYGGSLPSN